MRYGSVCSGIEAATCGWHPLGWEPQFFSEIDKTASRFLAAKFPNVPNHGDMTRFQEWPDHAIDLLVGGTPCQSFSVAGLRKGLADPRGNLMLTYLAIADRYRPRWLVWENVPGVLSSNGGRDFGTLLGGLAELGYGFAYAVRDAQYVRVESHPRAVPQRRRRVFVVGCLGDWRRAAAVLFERESLSGHPPPRRKAGQTAPTIPSRRTAGGGLGTDFDCDGGLVASTRDIAHCLNGGGMGRIDYETETFVAHALKGESFDASEDGTGRGVPLVPVVAPTLRAGGSATGGDRPYGTDVDTCDSLVPVVFDSKGTQVQVSEDGATPTLRLMNHDASHQNGGGQLAVAIQERAVCENPDAGPDGIGVRTDGAAYTLEARSTVQAVAFAENQRSEIRQMSVSGALSSIRRGDAKNETLLAQQWAVRRLTPLECIRLQGFPDDYFSSARLNKPLADGPIYKMLGNSFAVNVVRWIGERIETVNQIAQEERSAPVE